MTSSRIRHLSGVTLPVTACTQVSPYVDRPHVVHAGQGLKVGLYTPTILGGNSYLSWFYVRGAIKDPANTGTSKELSQAIDGGPIRKFMPKYANVYVTIQSHALSAGVRTYYAIGVRNGLRTWTVCVGADHRYVWGCWSYNLSDCIHTALSL